MNNIPRKIFFFYYNGFRSMTIGRVLWPIILIKLTIMFLVLKLFFFPNFLKEKFDTEEERSEYVRKQLTSSPKGG